MSRDDLIAKLDVYLGKWTSKLLQIMSSDSQTFFVYFFF